MATVRIVLGIICFAFFGQLMVPSGDFLRRKGWKEESLGFRVERLEFGVGKLSTKNLKLKTPNWKLETDHRKLILRIAQSQIGVREATGKNDGKVVEDFLAYTAQKKGTPWCASFVSWVYGRAGFIQPKTAWSPALFPLARQTKNPLPADVFGIYFSKLKRIAHSGIIEKSKGNWLTTIEGNTNLEGSREGDGVYRKLRHKRSIKTFANWIDEPRKELAL